MNKRGKYKIKRRMLSGVMAAAVVLSVVDVSGWKGVVAKAADEAQTEQEKEVEIREEEANEDFGGFGDLFGNDDDETTGYENGFAVDEDGNTVYQPAVLTTDKYDVDGDDNYDEVYEISNAGQLYWFANETNEKSEYNYNVVLTSDIVINENVLVDGVLAENTGSFRKWTPICQIGCNYEGVFDGKGHTISGIYCANVSEEFRYGIGVFGKINSSGTVKNLGVIDSYFLDKCEMGAGTGAIVGHNEGNIINCYNTGVVEGETIRQGGICGENYRGNIINCYNKGSVTGGCKSGSIGGICGINCKGSITDSYNTGNIVSSSEKIRVGGVCGVTTSGSTIRCGNIGNVTGFSEGYIGGVVGACNGSGKIQNSYNTGKISNSDSSYYVYAGGVCGESMDNALVENCYNTGEVTDYEGTTRNVVNFASTVTNCYYLSDTETDDEDGTTAKNEKEFAGGEVAYLLQGDQAEEVWGQTLGTDSYPVLGGDKVYKNGTYNGCIGNPGEAVSYEYSNTKNDIYGDNHIDTDNDGKCDACDAVIDGIGAKLAGYSLSLAGNIGVNFYMELSDDIVADESAYMNFTLPDGTTSKVYVSGTHEDGTTATTDTTVKDNTTYYVFTCEVTAKEMTADIQAQMIGNNGEKKGKVYTYTVKEYADYILSHMSADEGDVSKATIQLVKGMLNYGGAAQKYFGYKTDKLASDGLELPETVFDDTVIMNNITNDANKASVTYYNTQDKITFKSAYLSLNSTTDLCVYVQLAEDVTVNENTFGIWCNTDQISKDQYEVTKVNEENCYKITLHGVKASQLQEKYIFYVELSDTETAELKYGATSYAYTVMSSEYDNINNIESLREVVKALYAYGSCAEEYEYYKNERR